MRDVVRRLADGEVMTAPEAEHAFSLLMDGGVDEATTAAFLVALKVRGETAGELAGGVRALQRAAVDAGLPADGLVDTCGTGGGRLVTFNISTAAALVAAGAGARVAKHGNRSFTSRSGSADVLEALGVDTRPERSRLPDLLQEVGFVFLYAPDFHPAMRHVAPVRRALGVATVMNLLGPLASPARVRRQVVGVAEPAWVRLVAESLARLGHERALVVHGEPGMDEASPLGSTRLAEVAGGQVHESELDPATFGWAAFAPGELAGGEPADNARRIEAILAGELRGAARAAVELNAAAALYVAGVAADLEDGVERARTAIDGGEAHRTLERLREMAPRA